MKILKLFIIIGVHGSISGFGTDKSQKVAGLRLDVNEFFNLPNPSSLSWLK
jgi:hypothetical protein